MTLRLNGSTSGYTEIDAPAVAGNNSIALPTGNGTSGQFLQTNGSGALSFASAVVNGSSSAIVSGTAVASTSGTSIDFTGIPSWVKRVTVMFDGVSTNGGSSYLMQLGTSAGVTTSGYRGTTGLAYGTNVLTQSSTAGVPIFNNSAADTHYGSMQIMLVSSNSWVFSGTDRQTQSFVSTSAGGVTLSATLDRIRITTVNGTDTFDAGSINILYES